MNKDTLRDRILSKINDRQTLTVDEVMELVSLMVAECDIRSKEAQLNILRERNENLERHITDLELELEMAKHAKNDS